MPKKKRSFLDKKKSVTFSVVHRGGDGEDQEAEVAFVAQDGDMVGEEFNPFEDAVEEVSEATRRLDRENFGLPDDGYNYSKHLRTPGSGFFIQAVEAPQPKEDVQILVSRKSLKEVEEVEEEMAKAPYVGPSEDDDAASFDDDFMAALGGPVDPGEAKVRFEDADEDEEGEWYDDDDEDYDPERSMRPLQSCQGDKEIRMLDEQFDQLLKQYSDEEDESEEEEEDDEEDQEEAVGARDVQLYKDVFDEFLQQPAHVLDPAQFDDADDEEEGDDGHKDDKSDKGEDGEVRRELLTDESGEEQGEYTESEEEEEDGWDCETILSTLSNTDNHPKLLSEPTRKIRLGRQGMPMTTLAPVGERKGAKEEEGGGEEEEDEEERVNKGRARGKETAEERRARKAEVKAERREKRMKKKEKRIDAALETKPKQPPGPRVSVIPLR